MPDTLDLPVAYSPAHAARVLGVGRTLVYELLARGEIRGRKLGSRTLIERAELERYVAELPDYPGAGTSSAA